MIVTHIGESYASGAFRRSDDDRRDERRHGRQNWIHGLRGRQISAAVADKGIPTYYYRFSYVPESLDRESASHASDNPFFVNTQAQKYGDKTTAMLRDREA